MYSYIAVHLPFKSIFKEVSFSQFFLCQFHRKKEWLQLLAGANILQVKVVAGVQSTFDVALTLQLMFPLLAKGSLKLCRKQFMEAGFTVGEHFNSAKSLSAARGGNPIPAGSFQPLTFVYINAIHAVMQKPPSLGNNVCLFFQVNCN